MNYRNIFLLFIGLCVVLLMEGCVSKIQFDSVSNDYSIAQERISDLEERLSSIKEDNYNCINDKISLKERLDKTIAKSNSLSREIKASNNSIAREIEELNQTIKKKETIISLHETVIRLFDDSNHTLQSSIQEQIDTQDLETKITTASRTKLVLARRLFFQSGSAELSDEGRELLIGMRRLFQDEQYTNILIQGHTDDRPVKSDSEYADNWELSAMRATAVVQFLHKTLGIAPERLSAVGYGNYHPITSNDTAEGRQLNRRIEIILEKQNYSK